MLPVFAVAPLLSACLIPEAPEYGAPEKSPIFIINDTISPNPRNLLSLTVSTDNRSHAFSFKIRSEDANEEVVAVLYIDYKHKLGQFIDDRNYPPVTFNEPRTISLDLTVPDPRFETPGCHTVTLMVLHKSGWDDGKREVIGTPDDLASVTWFVSLERPGVPPAQLSACPNQATQADAVP
jgi:hypothetical protein